MLTEFNYSGGGLEHEKVILDRNSHYSARRAVEAALGLDLGVGIFSYSGILGQTNGGEDPMEICASRTGTGVKEQIKTIFVSDAPLDGQHSPNTAIAVLRYPDRAGFNKIAAIISRFPIIRGRLPVVGTLTTSHTLGYSGIIPGFLGINPDPILVPKRISPEQNEGFVEPYTDLFDSIYIIDESLRQLTRFCMLVGSGKADALVVIDGKSGELGDRVDAFFRRYFFMSRFVIADIVEGVKFQV